jgi:hypothetical protein
LDSSSATTAQQREQQILYLLGADVLAISNDDVLEAAHNGEESLFVECPQVTGLDVAVFVESGFVE